MGTVTVTDMGMATTATKMDLIMNGHHVSPLTGAALSVGCLVVLLCAITPTARAHDPTPAATAAASASNAPAEQPQSAPGEAKEGERLVSLVLLLSGPRKPTHEAIAHAVGEGLGQAVSKDAVVSKPPYHLVNAGADKFVINDIGQPYFEDSAKVADEIKNPNLSRAVRDHRAWISVDWVSADKQTDLRNVYQMIGKMIAHLSGKDTLAVYSPDMDQFALWAPTVRQGLESDDPLAVFEPADGNQPAAPAATAPSPANQP